MNDRQKELFHNIVLEHITTAKAIGSEFLVKKYNLEVSSATTRNDMAELEAEGLIYQPHTSAGRVPTERGYNYYVANYLSKNNTYYTGLSNLLSQPEFADFNLIYRLTEVVDNFDEVLDGLYDKIKDIEIKIGKDNAFSSDCASILTKKSGKVFGLIGPMRMDYERNLGLVTFVRELLN